MDLGGYQKLTLQDYPGHVAAICFANGCQLRCPYCHNPEFVLPRTDGEAMADGGICRAFTAYLQKRRGVLDGVVVTGGEPLLQADVLGFLSRIKALGFDVKLDTNGMCPDALKRALDAGLADYVALDYKNRAEDWARTTGVSRESARSLYARWQRSLSVLRGGGIPYEIRTTVARGLHPPSALADMARYLASGERQPSEVWFLQSFRRSGPLLQERSEDAPQVELSAYGPDELELMTQKLRDIYPNTVFRESRYNGGSR